VSDTVATPGVEKTAAAEPRASVLSGRRGRALRESLLAYLFLLPAFLIIFTFGIFPLAFSAYQSTLRGLNRIVGTPAGMDNYVRATGELAYVVGFWLSIVFLILAVNQLRQLVTTASEHAERPWPLALPGIVLGIGFALFTRAFFIFLPLLLGIADQMRTAQQQGEGPPSELFRRFVAETLALPEVRGPFLLSFGVLLAGVLLVYLVLRNRPHNPRQGGYFGAFFQMTVLTLAALALGWFTWQAVQAAYTAAAEAETELAIWSHIVTISAGFVLLVLSWFIWRSANRRDSNLSTVLRLTAAAVLMIGAWVLIGEIPRAASSGDSRWWTGLLNTVWYTVGSIPFQFAISLMLATFLFQNIKGKALFRMIYFLPYITPTVGAAAVFRVIFSGRATAPMNSLLSLFGLDTLGWLNEPTGIFQLMAGSSTTLPAWAAGPSLSLVVIIIFGIWSFVGFNTVIFLAGLGGIPTSLYEAASIDGAGRWAQFRHVTLPLLSPTIYFLTLYAVIGTFKAFNHIYVLRSPAALGTADTVSVVIFDAMKRDTRYGYAAALAMLLLIIVMALTVVNNRIASKRVFYG
jgi:ABC-type sugar transport system permease subunit